MSIDQLLYVAARIHDPAKTAIENIGRAVELVLSAEAAIRANDRVVAMKQRGLSGKEMMLELMGKKEA
jgi:hypothetical protein